MSPRPIAFLGSALLSASLVLTPFSEALAGGMGGYGGGYGDIHSGPRCKNGGVNIYKPVNVFKPVVINKNIDIFKPVIINKNNTTRSVARERDTEITGMTMEGGVGESAN